MWGWLVSVLVSCSHPVTVKLCHVTLISTNTAVGIFSVHSLLFWVLGDSKKALANFFGALGSLFSSDNVHLCTMCIVSLKEWGDDSHTGWLDKWQLVGKISLPAKQSLFSKVSSTGRQHIFILLTKPSKIWYRVRGKARSAYQCFLVVINWVIQWKAAKGEVFGIPEVLMENQHFPEGLLPTFLLLSLLLASLVQYQVEVLSIQNHSITFLSGCPLGGPCLFIHILSASYHLVIWWLFSKEY